MNILVVSDTHNNIALFRKVLAENKSDMLIHLGDYWEDSQKANFKDYSKSLYRVPGIYHPGYRNGNLPAIEDLDLHGIPVKLVHNIEDINFSKTSNQVIFYGHTHIAQVSRYSGNILINPGHLKLDEDRGQLASFVKLILGKNDLTVEMHEVVSGLVQRFKIIKNQDNILELVYDG